MQVPNQSYELHIQTLENPFKRVLWEHAYGGGHLDLPFVLLFIKLLPGHLVDVPKRAYIAYGDFFQIYN